MGIRVSTEIESKVPTLKPGIETGIMRYNVFEILRNTMAYFIVGSRRHDVGGKKKRFHSAKVIIKLLHSNRTVTLISRSIIPILIRQCENIQCLSEYRQKGHPVKHCTVIRLNCARSLVWGQQSV